MGEVGERAPDEVTLAQAALAATRAVPGVAGISRGRYAIARTFGLGGSVVEGVQFTLDPQGGGLCVEIHVVVRLVPIPPLAAAIRAAVVTVLTGLGTDVSVVDVWVDALRDGEMEEEA